MKLSTFSIPLAQPITLPERRDLDPARTLLIVFGPSEMLHSPALLKTLLSRHPGVQAIGCSSAGEIFDTTIQDDSLACALLEFEHTTVRTASAHVSSALDSQAAAESLARELLAPDLQGIIALSDGLSINGSKLICGLNTVLPPHVVVTGGLAGDGTRFKETWVLEQDQPKTGYVTAAGFYGPAVRLTHGSKGGWDVFGPERLVTRAEGNVLYELNHKPALALYKDYLGELASQLPGAALRFPLAIRQSPDDPKRLVRTILAVDEATQSMTFAGDIPKGAYAQFMRANFDRLVQGASDAAALASGSPEQHGPLLSLAISCVGRRLVLGQRTEEEVEAVLDHLPSGTKQIGFYSYGEISPYATGRCDLHNQTMTLTTISERVDA